jgi:hypothetical protein
VNVVGTLAQVGVTTFAVLLIGRRCASQRWRFAHPALNWSAYGALGLLILSYLIFALAALRLATAGALALLFAALTGFTLAALWRTRSRAAAVMQTLREQARGVSPAGFWIILSGAAALVIWIVLCAFLPATVRDELIYHLAIPKLLLHSRGNLRFADNIYAYFPQLGEMLFLFGLGLSGEAAAKLFHSLAGFLVALGLYGFSREYLTRAYSALAVVLFLSVPSVVAILSWAYVDLFFSLYVFISLVSLLEYFKSGRLQWMVLAGVMAGGACATKYTGLQVLLLFALIVLLEHRMSRRPGWPAAAAVLMAGALPALIPYLGRNFLLTGWPLFPFQAGLFRLDAGINWDPERAQLYLRWLSSFGTTLGRESAWDTLLAPVLVFIRARFDETRYYEGVVGPVFLLTPLLLPKIMSRREIRWLVLFCLLFLSYWTLTTRQVRFLIPILPVISFLLACGLQRIRSRLIPAAVLVFAFVSSAVGVQKTWELRPLPFWMGRQSRQQYLTQHLDVYSIYQAANQQVGTGGQVYLIDMKNYGYYLDCRWRGDFIFEDYRLVRLLESSNSERDVLEFFRTNGITHLLLNEGLLADPKWGLKPNHLATFRSFLSRNVVLLARDSAGHSLSRLKL